MVDGSLSDSIPSQKTGNSAKTKTRRSATIQVPRRRFIEWPLLLPQPARRGGAEALDEQERDEHDHQEDQHRDGGAEPQVQPREQLVAVEDRDGLDVRVVAVGD